MAKRTKKPKSAKKPKPSGVARTLGEVAAHFGVARDTVRSSWKAAGMPKLPCTWKELERWRETLRKRETKDDPAAQSSVVTIAREKKITSDAMAAEARAIIALHEARMLQTDVASLALVERFLSEFLTALRTQLLRLPGEISAAYPVTWRDTLSEDLRQRIELTLQAMHGQAATLVDLKQE